MNPRKVDRSRLHQLTDLPNVGPAMADDLQRLGITRPTDLSGCDPYVLYERLCALDGKRHDPCVIDVFMAATRFVAGEPAQAWWRFTEERKQTLAARKGQDRP